jgi:hypothetical protein
MPTENCPECDRLWREHSEVSQRSFRIEARLIRARTIQDHDLVQALAGRLASLMQEQNRTSEAFVEHQAKAHPRKSPAGSPRLGD